MTAGLLTLSLTGCGGGSLTDVDAAATLADQLGNVGIVLDQGSLECADIELEKDATVSCAFTISGQPVKLTAKVTGVSGTKVDYTISTEAQDVPAETLAGAVRARAGQALGAAIDDASCTAALKAEVGATSACTLVSGDQSKEITVTVSGIDGGRIDYTVEAS